MTVTINGTTGITTPGITNSGNETISGSLSVSSSNVSSAQSFRNKFINGNFDYWQRATSNTNVVNAQYVADRWINLKSGSPTLNISRQSFTVGQTDVPNEPTYYLQANTIS